MTFRKNQAALTTQQWADFIDAINQTHGVTATAPRYRDFVKVHMRAMDANDPDGMSWNVHTMGRNMPGTNFFAWHRQLILRFEKRLQKVHATITLPYWDAVNDRELPQALNDPELLKSWSVSRDWNSTELPSANDQKAVLTIPTFSAFQSALEASVHNAVHRAVGGDMVSAGSPTDPLFFLHHANIDRLWASWQAKHPGQDPPNADEVLKPKPLFGIKVATLISTTGLGYEYR